MQERVSDLMLRYLLDTNIVIFERFDQRSDVLDARLAELRPGAWRLSPAISRHSGNGLPLEPALLRSS